MITVAWFFEEFPFGGAEKVTLDLAHGFLRYAPEEVRPVIIARRFGLRPDGIECIELGSGAPMRKPDGRQALATVLRRVGADVYIQAMDAVDGLLPALRAALPGIRIVYHIHNEPYWQVRLKCAGGRVKALRERLFRTYSRRYRRIYAENYAASDCFVALCEEYTLSLRDEFGAGVHTLYNPLDSDAFGAARATEKQREVLYMGRLDRKHKHVDRLLRAWADVHPVHPDWRLRIVGGGPDAQALGQLASRLGLRNVEFCGATDRPADYYATASILALTSAYEGWPLVLPEALAAGVRVVAMDCSAGVSEILRRSGSTAVPPADERALARALSDRMTRPGGNGGAPDAFLADLSLPTVISAWLDLLRNICKKA